MTNITDKIRALMLAEIDELAAKTKTIRAAYHMMCGSHPKSSVKEVNLVITGKKLTVGEFIKLLGNFDADRTITCDTIDSEGLWILNVAEYPNDDALTISLAQDSDIGSDW